MVHKIILLLTGMIWWSVGAAQLNETQQQRFFFSTVYSPFLDFVNSPVYLQNTPVEWDANRNPIRFEQVPSQILGISYLSVGIEPRYNLKEWNDNTALAVTMPATIGFAIVGASGNDVAGASGIGNVQIPLLLKMYLGNGSTYRTEKNMGFSMGAGLEYNKLPLLFQSNNSADEVFRSGWVMPAVSTGLHIWRGNMPMEFNLKFGFGRLRAYSRDKNGEPIVDNTTLQNIERFSRAYSFKLTFVYPMSY